MITVLIYLPYIDCKKQIKEESECPVCYRVLRAMKDMKSKNNMTMRDAFNKYCEIDSLEVDDSKFCYNTANIRNELFRLIDLGNSITDIIIFGVYTIYNRYY